MSKHRWTKAEKEKILDVFDLWRSHLQLDRWEIQITFSDDKNHGFSADALRRTPYRQGDITVYPSILGKSDPFLHITVIHELLHLVMWPLKEWEGDENTEIAKAYDEEITDYLAQTIYFLTLSD